MTLQKTASAAPVSITKRFINEIEFPSHDEGRRVVWDSQLKGFGIRVYPAGTIVFVVQYRMKAKGAKTQTLTIGKYGSPWSPDSARKEAQELLHEIHRGTDPIAARRAAEAADKSAALEEAHYDFDAFVDRYIELHVKANGLRSLKDIEATFNRDLRPFFKGKSVRQITKQDCKDMRVAVGARSKSAANKAHKWLNAAFMWGIENDGVVTNPMFGLKKPFKEVKRSRVLAEWEVAIIWSVLPQMAWQFAMLMRLLILTGQRLREVAGMRWEEIDLRQLAWTIPGSRTKNKLDHLVPISPQVERLLVAIQPDPSLRQGLLLTTNGRTPISGFSKSKTELDALVAQALHDPRWRGRGPVLPWVRHDARRTLSTMCGEMSVPLEHAEAVLNHVSGTLDGVAGTYWLYKYAKEKRAALMKWGARVERNLKKHGVELVYDCCNQRRL
jgi:integrase